LIRIQVADGFGHCPSARNVRWALQLVESGGDAMRSKRNA
jgi:hypothetical protein